MNNEDKILQILGTMQEDIHSMKDDIQGMKDDIQDLRSDMQGVKFEIQGLKSDMQGVKSEITKLHGKVDALAKSQEQTRVTVNALVEWSDRITSVYELPLPKL